MIISVESSVTISNGHGPEQKNREVSIKHDNTWDHARLKFWKKKKNKQNWWNNRMEIKMKFSFMVRYDKIASCVPFNRMILNHISSDADDEMIYSSLTLYGIIWNLMIYAKGGKKKKLTRRRKSRRRMQKFSRPKSQCRKQHLRIFGLWTTTKQAS